MTKALGLLRALLGRFRHVSPPERPVETGGYASPVDAYWNAHTVNSVELGSAWESKRYMEWRFRQYPLFREFLDLWGRHDGEVLLDYGCGPGDDLAGFLVHTRARQVIGADISAKALALAKARIGLHGIATERYQLIELSDAQPAIPLETASVDYVHSGGVLHHTSFPESIVRELNRVLKPGGRACIMVYNRDSVWYHVYVAYQKMVLEGAFAELSTDEAFPYTTDGPNCPTARCYSAPEWLALCRGAGFGGEFIGGYFSMRELDLLRMLKGQAIADARLPAPHRDFLSQLTPDAKGFPLYRGKHAGIGGVYRLTKRAT